MATAIETGVSLRALNTFGVEARTAFFASVRDVRVLRDVLADPRVADLPRLILGGGSNILFTRDFDGLVVRIDIPGYARLGDDGNRWLVRVGAGESWHGTVGRLLDDGLHGLENLALIPGSAGAAPWRMSVQDASRAWVRSAVTKSRWKTMHFSGLCWDWSMAASTRGL